MIDRFDAQRKLLDIKFYERLEKDIVNGCMIPPITLAFVSKDMASEKELDIINKYINDNIKEGFILDGIQRINTLFRANELNYEAFPRRSSLLLNIIISESSDMLLYRMITLNNGQKAMSPRHQIEILTKGLFNKYGYSN